MKYKKPIKRAITLAMCAAMLGACSTYQTTQETPPPSNTYTTTSSDTDYESRMPQHFNTGGEKEIVVNPRVRAWGAYDANGDLMRSGIATSGGDWCHDTGRPCRTATGTYRLRSLGDEDCKSSKYPLPNGGGPMPYCMFFKGGQSIHGSPPMGIVDDNVSHGCVRIPIPDAEWLRYNFASVGTKIVILPY